MATPQSPFSFLTTLAESIGTHLQPPAWLVHEGQHRIVLFLNHVLLQEPEATSRLVRQKGQVALMQWRLFSLRLVITPAGLLDIAEAHQPAEQPHAMIHNDYRFDNLVLDREDPTRIAGVLDWELATVGDPLMDVGSLMAYWCQADDPQDVRNIRLQPTDAPGMWTRVQVWDAYAERRGITVPEQDRRFYELFGTFRLAGIAQQIYYRAFHGQTTNPTARFMGIVVHVLDARCRELLG